MKKIQASFILEILGRPKEHILDGLNQLIQRLSKEQGVVILEQIVHEPHLVKDSKDLFTTFAELTLEIDNLPTFFGLLFGYMPANVEIISPEEISIKNTDFNELGSRIMHRLHDYDAVAKKMIYERDVLLRKLQEVAPHLFKAPAPVTQPANSPQSPKEPTKKKQLSKSSKKPKKK